MLMMLFSLYPLQSAKVYDNVDRGGCSYQQNQDLLQNHLKIQLELNDVFQDNFLNFVLIEFINAIDKIINREKVR